MSHGITMHFPDVTGTKEKANHSLPTEYFRSGIQSAGDAQDGCRKRAGAGTTMPDTMGMYSVNVELQGGAGPVATSRDLRGRCDGDGCGQAMATVSWAAAHVPII
ncbi:MAG: hypothetical protein ACLTDV_08985 [Eubacterium sp.]